MKVVDEWMRLRGHRRDSNDSRTHARRASHRTDDDGPRANSDAGGEQLAKGTLPRVRPTPTPTPTPPLATMLRLQASSSRRWVSATFEHAHQSHASTSKIPPPPARCSYSTTVPARSTKSSSTAPPAAAPSPNATSRSQASPPPPPPLPWLNKPLGVRNKPTAQPISQSRKERMDYYLEKGRLEERERIIENAAKGYFHDFHDIRRNGGKSWRAPTTMIRSNRALYFPRIEGTCLKDRATKNTAEMCDRKVSVVCLLNTGISLVSAWSAHSQPNSPSLSH